VLYLNSRDGPQERADENDGSAEQARKAKTTPFSVSLAIVTMMFHET
jgi:hypothetical protein